MANLLNDESSKLDYQPVVLIEHILKITRLKNDAALSRALEVAPPVISKIRHRKLALGASLLIRLHELTGISIVDLRKLMGDHRKKFNTIDLRE